jgi:hypothetical protein
VPVDVASMSSTESETTAELAVTAVASEVESSGKRRQGQRRLSNSKPAAECQDGENSTAQAPTRATRSSRRSSVATSKAAAAGASAEESEEELHAYYRNKGYVAPEPKVGILPLFRSIDHDVLLF